MGDNTKPKYLKTFTYSVIIYEDQAELITIEVDSPFPTGLAAKKKLRKAMKAQGFDPDNAVVGHVFEGEPKELIKLHRELVSILAD